MFYYGSLIGSAAITSIFLILASISIHYIYLTPTIIPNLPIYNTIRPVPKVKRTLILVSDGLRSDIAFKEKIMPNLHRRLTETKKIICRTSLANAPTESVPNHIAMLAGFPEDLARVWNGFRKVEPDFDHLLRRASHAFALGGPDVVEYFKGSTVTIDSFPYHLYSSEENPINLDIWVLERYRKLLSQAIEDKELEGRLKSDGLVIFLHLAGVDTVGHRHGALSSDYEQATRAADTIINSIDAITREFYKDEQTLFVFTSDHGFPDVGGHGTTDIHARQCPFVAWGTPTLPENQNECQKIMRQGQISPLISAYMGISTPANSQFTFPTDLLTGSEEERTKAILSSYGQLVFALDGQYNRLASRSLSATPILRALANNVKSNLHQIEDYLGTGKSGLATPLLNQGMKTVILSDYGARCSWKIVTGIPLFILCLSLLIGKLYNQETKMLRTWKHFLWNVGLAMIGCIFWYFLVFRNLFLSFLVGCAIWNITRWDGVMESELAMIILVGALKGLLLWSGKFWLVATACVVIPLHRRGLGKIKTCEISLVGVALTVLNFEIMILAKNIICLVGITWLTKKIFDMITIEAPSLHPHIKSISLLMGFYLKFLLFLEHWLPFLSLPCGMVMTGIVSVVAFMNRNNPSNRKALLALTLIVGSSITIDWRLLFGIMSAIYFVLTLERYDILLVNPNTFASTKSPADWISPIELNIILLLIVVGPQVVSWHFFQFGYLSSPLTRFFAISKLWQWPLTAILGMGLWRLAICTPIDAKMATLVASRSSAISLVIMAILMPKQESWLEIAFGIVKVILVALTPLAMSLIFAVLNYNLLKYRAAVVSPVPIHRLDDSDCIVSLKTLSEISNV